MDLQRLVELLPLHPPRQQGLAASGALLSRAIAQMADDEVYCQIGNLPGEVWAEALTKTDASDKARLTTLEDQLTALDSQCRVWCDRDDAEAFFAHLRDYKHESVVTDRIGLYVYNGATDYRSLLLGLLLATPFLADRALIVVCQAKTAMARQAVQDFLAACPQADWLHEAANQTTAVISDVLQLGWDALTHWSNASSFAPGDRVVLNAFHSLHQQQYQTSLETLRAEAIQLHVEGQLADAEHHYRTILLHDPTNAEIWSNLGMLHNLAGANGDAIAALQQSLSLNPTNALAYQILGLAFERLGQESEAIAAYRDAILLDASDRESLNNLGQLWLKQGAVNEAEPLFRQAISVCPNHFAGYVNLGDALIAQHQPEAALEQYRQALTCKKRDPEILHKIGAAYKAMGDFANAHNYFAYGFYRAHQHEAAIVQFQKFLALKPEGSQGDFTTYADCLFHCGQTDAVRTCLQRAAEFQPEDAFLQIMSDLTLPLVYTTSDEITLYRQRYFQAFERLAQQFEASLTQPKPLNIGSIQGYVNFFLDYQGQNDRQLYATYGKLLQSVVAKYHPEWTVPLPMPPLSATGKIRIGYIADKLGNNSDTRWAAGWLKNHDRERFELYCYNVGSEADRKTEQFRWISDRFYQLPTLREAYQQIISDQLHILVFLVVGASPYIASIASLRLAPVQCCAWGHAVTSGIPTMDYFLSGDLMEPANAQEHYTETLVRLPNLGISYTQPPLPPITKTRADFGLPAKAVIYLCCQLIPKYLPQHDSILVEIARQVPDARLVFVLRSNATNRTTAKVEAQFQQRLRLAFAQADLEMDDYCTFLPGQSWEDYTSLLRCVDVFLDTIAFSGGYTTFDAIACNLPVVTHAGELMRGRQSYGMLTLLGVTDTIAATEDEYLDIAVRLGVEPGWRQAIAQRMGKNHANLFDDTACVDGLEQFYQQVVTAKLKPPTDC